MWPLNGHLSVILPQSSYYKGSLPVFSLSLMHYDLWHHWEVLCHTLTYVVTLYNCTVHPWLMLFFTHFRYCLLQCTEHDIDCRPGMQFKDVLTFRSLALPNGIPARRDLIRLVAYDQFGIHLPQTTFTILENDPNIPFGIRREDGKGVLYTLEPLQEQKTYVLKVQAKSFDHRRPHEEIHYQTTFLIYISVSLYPYWTNSLVYIIISLPEN